MLNIPTKYIKAETGWGLLACTIALTGAAIIPRWNPLIEYCVPHAECRRVLAVDPELFQWHQAQASSNNEKLKQKAKARAKHKHGKNFDLGETVEQIDDTLGDASTDFGEFAVGMQHTFAPKSSKEFLRLTAEARRRGWQLEPVQELPGYADWRKVAGALSLISVAGTAWLVGQIEILQEKRDRRSELDEEFDLQQHRKALEGEATVIHAEIDWVSATEQKALEAEYLGDDYDDFIDEQSIRLDENINSQEGALTQLTGTQTLDSINNPSDKVQGQQQDAIAPNDQAKQPNWVKGFLSSTSLVWGNQGSGKSWFVRLLALLKKQKGYKVIVFDPNSNRSEWMGVELYNTYDQIELQMQWYVDEVMGRYKAFGKTEISEDQWRKDLWQQGKAITIVCEEMTTYSDFIIDKELLTKFVKVAATLSRKQEMPVTFVTHNNTQSCMGEIKGLANLISRMQQIQLLATTDEKTSQPVASGKALIKMDGSDEWVEITTPKLNKKIKDFRGESEKVGDGREYLERTWNLEFDVKDSSGDSTTPQPEQSTPKLSPIAQKILAWLKQNKADGSWLKYKGKEGRDGNFINFLSDIGADWKSRDVAIHELLTNVLVVVDDEKGMRLIEVSDG